MKRRTKRAIAVLAVLGIAGFLAFRSFGFTPVEPWTPARQIALGEPILEYDEYVKIDHPLPYVLDVPSSRGALRYFGAAHTQDPSHPEIARVKEEWSRFRPTVALVEGYLGWYVGGLDGGVRRFGEVGAAFALARRDGVPVHSLEAPAEIECAALVKEFEPEHVALFYVLRAFTQARASGDGSDARAESVRAKRTSRYGLESALPSLAAMDALWKRDFAGLPDWREIPEEALHPGRTATKLNLVATRCNRFRDEHMVRVLADFVRRGERVFAVCGATHVVMQERCLRAILASE